MSLEVENNNSTATANTLVSGVATTGQVSSYSDQDYYKIGVSAGQTVQFSLNLPSSNWSTYDVDLYDTFGTLQRAYSTYSSESYSIAAQSSGFVYAKVSSYSGRSDYQISAVAQGSSTGSIPSPPRLPLIWCPQALLQSTREALHFLR